MTRATRPAQPKQVSSYFLEREARDPRRQIPRWFHWRGSAVTYCRILDQNDIFLKFFVACPAHCYWRAGRKPVKVFGSE